jgi:hypothetical protein
MQGSLTHSLTLPTELRCCCTGVAQRKSTSLQQNNKFGEQGLSINTWNIFFVLVSVGPELTQVLNTEFSIRIHKPNQKFRNLLTR